MILTTTVIRHQPPSVLAALLVLSLLPLYFISYQLRLHYPFSPPTASTSLDLPVSSPSDFISTWLSHPLLPFNPAPLRSYCNTSHPNPNLVLNLANANGGIGNVRGNLLDFLFFALESGSSIILPGFSGRDKENIGNVWGGWREFGEFFDREWFLEQMGIVCPRMEIFEVREGMEMLEAVNGEKGNWRWRSRRMDAGFENSRQNALEGLREFVKETTQEDSEEGSGEMKMVNLERTLWEVDTRALPGGFRREFGGLLRLRGDVRRLAALVMRSLGERFGVEIDPTDGIPKKAFYGAHLRTEADAGAAGWLDDDALNANFSAQTDAYIAHAVKHKLAIIYVATGNESELAAFKEKAERHRPAIVVTSKYDLLPASEAAAFEKLSWDQKALVDYEVLKRCSVFGGFVKSSFSYNVAMARNQWLEDQGWVTDPWFVQHSEFGVSFDDGLSRIVGRDAWHEGRIPRGMWP